MAAFDPKRTFTSAQHWVNSITSATSAVPISKCGNHLAISKAASMLSAFKIENPGSEKKTKPQNLGRLT